MKSLLKTTLKISVFFAVFFRAPRTRKKVNLVRSGIQLRGSLSTSPKVIDPAAIGGILTISGRNAVLPRSLNSVSNDCALSSWQRLGGARHHAMGFC